MKTAKIILSIMVMLVFLGLNDAMGQLGLAWIWSGTIIYNANSGNVGIGPA